jgi:hypothetical protein
MNLSDRVYSLGMDEARRFVKPLALLAYYSSRVPVVVLAMLNFVDYLLIAKPDAFNQLGIRRDCATL